MDKTLKAIIFWVVIAFSATVLWMFVRTAPKSPETPEISYSQFLERVESGAVLNVRISGNLVKGTYRDGGSFQVTAPTDQTQMNEMLRSKNVEIWYTANDKSTNAWLINLLPLGLLTMLWFFMIRRMKARQIPPPSGTSGSLQGT